MNRRESFRSLLLEQLESRSLLAGADCVVATEWDQGNRLGADRLERNDHAELRRQDSDRSERADDSRTHQSETKSRHRDAHHSRGSGRGNQNSYSRSVNRVDVLPGRASSVISSGSPPPSHDFAEVTPRPTGQSTNLIGLVGREPISFVVISVGHFVSSALVSHGSNPSSNGTASNGTASNGTAPTSNDANSAPLARNDPSQAEASSDRAPSHSESARAESAPSDRAGVAQQSSPLSNLPAAGQTDSASTESLDRTDVVGSERNSVMPLSTANDASTVETIDSLPIFQRETPRSGDLTPLDPWKLDQASIDELKEISKPRSNASTNESDRLTDATIASWFGQGTGFVEFGLSGDLPLDATTRALVSVELDATMGLHRMVGLLASEHPHNADHAAEVRDAVLAALVAEPTSPTDLDSGDVESSRYAAVALPGAAMIAAGISIAARRHRKGNVLNRTSRKGRNETP